MSAIATRTAREIREALLSGAEIALLDVREEDPHAQGHPLFAANLPLSRLELQAPSRLPCRAVPIVVFDDGEDLAQPAARKLQTLGYRDVSLLEGGLEGWRAAGGEVFRDVNAPSKAFGELVEARRHTPSLDAEAAQALLQSDAQVVVLDARRYDEYRTMNIPGSISVPGAELVLRAAALAPDPQTRIVVNCAGRTRSIIGAQSLINAGLPNPVCALRNGTIGWTLAGQALEQGSARHFHPEAGRDAARLAVSREAARRVAARAGVKRIDPDTLSVWSADRTRTLYRFDVRAPQEFRDGHLPGFLNAPGGQLVQETDWFAPVRGARVVLVDDDGVRANMTASWLAQMNVDVYVLDTPGAFDEMGDAPLDSIAPPPVAEVDVATLASWLERSPAQTCVLDLAPSATYVAGHIPGAWWILRSRLAQDLPALPEAQRYVLTCGSSALARHAVPELAALTGKPVFVLEGGNAAWRASGLSLSQTARLASPRTDRYRRPYEGTDAPVEAMQAYLDWEYGLVEQLRRDGTHGFSVI